MKRSIVLLFTLSLLLIGVGGARSAMAGPGAGSSSAGSAFTAVSEYCADAEEQAFLTQINNYRAQNGLPALKFVQSLSAAAYHHSLDMASNNYFSHTLLNGTTWDQNIRDHGYTFATSLAENIAAGNSSAANTFTQWKNSAGHNANMLSTAYVAIGIGRAYSATSQYGWYWTTTFGGVTDTAATYCASTPTPTATATATATATPTASTTVFVSAMSGSKTVAKSGAVTLSYKVTVKDTAGKLVANAQVSVEITAPNGAKATVSATTTTKGIATVSSKATAGSGNYVGRVTNIVAPGKPYNATRNVMVSVTITV